jgi:hypothetical protein
VARLKINDDDGDVYLKMITTRVSQKYRTAAKGISKRVNMQTIKDTDITVQTNNK